MRHESATVPLPIDSPLPRSPSLRSLEGLLSTLYMNSSGSFGIWKRTSSCACIGDGDVAILQTPPPSTQQPATSNTAKAENPHTRARICVCAGSPTDEPASFRYYERALRAVPSTRASFRPSDIQHVRDYDDSQCTLYIKYMN